MQTLHTPACCGPERPFLSSRDRNRRIGNVRFDYVRCDTCGLIRLANPPDDLGSYYPADYYALRSKEQLAAIARRDPFRIRIVQRFSQPGRLLEIGPASGTFALQSQQAGYQVSAIEMDERCCSYLCKQLGINAVRSDVPHEAMATFANQDVIALWHVIEHLPDPWSLMRQAARSLASGGILVIASPNPDAWQFSVMGGAWPHIDAPRHLYLLPANVLVTFAAPLGLACIHLSTEDDEARRWNRFGWQRLLMNLMPDRWTQRAAFLVGRGLSLIASPLDRRRGKGSAYTLVLQKCVP